ncbi:hypothetical protein V8E54_000551 [Elaphomyces granulatus]
MPSREAGDAVNVGNAPSNSPPLNDSGREGDHDEECFECWCSPDDGFCLSPDINHCPCRIAYEETHGFFVRPLVS